MPGTDVSLSFPGSLGGMNWGSLSTDPNNHYIFVNDMRLGLWVQLIKQDPQSAVANTGGEAVNAGMGAVPMKGTPYSVNKTVSCRRWGSHVRNRRLVRCPRLT